MYQIAVQPFTVRLFLCVHFFQFIVIDDLALYGIHQKHFSRMETLF